MFRYFNSDKFLGSFLVVVLMKLKVSFLILSETLVQKKKRTSCKKLHVCEVDVYVFECQNVSACVCVLRRNRNITVKDLWQLFCVLQ